MRSRVILHVVLFVLAEAQLRNRPSGSYQDLLLSCANLKVPVRLGTSGDSHDQPQCEHGSVSFLLSENHGMFRDEGIDKANRRELMVYNGKRQKRENGEIAPQRISARVQDKQKKFLFLSCIRRDTQLLTVSLNLSKIDKIKPQATIHVNYLVPTGVVNIHESCEDLKSNRRLQRSKPSENIKQTTKKDPFERLSSPWTNLWIMQEVRLVNDAEDGVFQRAARSRDPEFSRLKKRNSDDHDLALVPWQTLWLLQEVRPAKDAEGGVFQKAARSGGPEFSRLKKRNSDDHDLALVPWQTLWLLQGESTECRYPGQILRFGTSVKDKEKNEWLHPLPKESLGNCPVRFRPLLDPYRWLPRVLVETECVCEGSPCALRGLHVCVTVYATRSLYSLRGGRRRVLVAVGCLCAIQKSRLATAISPNTVD